jgi:hypothetical protein
MIRFAGGIDSSSLFRAKHGMAEFHAVDLGRQKFDYLGAING